MTSDDLELLEDMFDGNIEGMVESQLTPKNYNEINRATIKKSLLLIISHPWTRLVSIYKSYYETFNYKYFLEHGKYMSNESRINKKLNEGEREWWPGPPLFRGALLCGVE